MNLPPDSGLQAERTALAWKRTALLIMANALIILRLGFQNTRLTMLLAGALFVLFAVAFTWIAYRRSNFLIMQRSNSNSGITIGAASLLITTAVLFAICMVVIDSL